MKKPVLQGEHVTAVCVTHNRPDLLIQCLKSLENQSHCLKAIYLVDNASTTATREMLVRHGYIDKYGKEKKRPDCVPLFYRYLEENCGGAGGFHEALAWALESGSDWFFILDDDVEATPTAVETMLRYRSQSKCIHPLKQYEDGTPIYWEGHFDVKSGRTIFNDNQGFKNGKDWVQVNYGCFEGMLVHRDIVNKIGLPDKRFFLINDDLVYGWLASFYTQVIYINHLGLIKHRVPEKSIGFSFLRTKQLSSLVTYLSVRNHFLLAEYLRTRRISHYSIYYYIGLKVIKLLVQSILVERSYTKFLRVLQGFKDGMKGRFYRPKFLLG